jgi:8-oxo-dGTP diphosphatase
MQKTELSQQKPIVVVAAIIRDQKRILISKRSAASRFGANQWEFPGGKLEFAESPEDCLKREIREELNLEIEVESFFDLVSHVYRDEQSALHVVLLSYFARVIGGELQMKEVADARWIEPGELTQFKFAAADIPFVDKILQGQSALTRA